MADAQRTCRGGDRVGAFAAVHESESGTFETCRSAQKMSALRGRPEVIGAWSDCRDCRVGPGSFTPVILTHPARATARRRQPSRRPQHCCCRGVLGNVRFPSLVPPPWIAVAAWV